MTDIKSAMDAVLEDEMSLRQASKNFGVNRQTLKNRLSGVHEKQSGGQCKFTVEEENSFADLLMHCANMGVPLSTVLLRKVIFSYCKSKKITYSSGAFTPKWHRAFLARNPKISFRICRPINRKKASDWTSVLCESWIEKMSGLAEQGYLDDPSSLWNLDESAFALAEVWKRVYAVKGVKWVEGYFDGNAREQMTVLAGGNAAGLMLRPFILYDGQLQLSSRFEGTDDKCLIGVNKSGWMDNPNFTSFVKAELIPAMTTGHINNLEFLQACRDSYKDIKVVCFPSGQTSRLQPLDRSVFGGVKYRWREHLRGLQAGCFDGLPLISRNTFPQHLIRLFEKSNLAATLKSGFFRTGIFPFSPEVIRATVVKNTLISLGFPTVAHESPKRRIRQALNDVKACPADVSSFLLEFHRIAQGQTSAHFVAVSYHSTLVQTAPVPRKRKDVRFATKSGENMTESGRLVYLEQKRSDDIEKQKEKKEKAAVKKAAKSADGTKPGKKKRTAKKALKSCDPVSERSE